MSAASSPIALGLAEHGEPVVLLGGGRQAADLPELLRLAPGLRTDGPAGDLAHAVNHLAHGTDYDVITDPASFASTYLARIAREDPDAEWQEGVVRLRDFGVPDFERIAPPELAGDALIYYAVDSFLGLPYRVVLSDFARSPSYEPLPLTPCPRPAPSASVAPAPDPDD
jgi:hypothetical protein